MLYINFSVDKLHISGAIESLDSLYTLFADDTLQDEDKDLAGGQDTMFGDEEGILSTLFVVVIFHIKNQFVVPS